LDYKQNMNNTPIEDESNSVIKKFGLCWDYEKSLGKFLFVNCRSHLPRMFPYSCHSSFDQHYANYRNVEIFEKQVSVPQVFINLLITQYGEVKTSDLNEIVYDFNKLLATKGITEAYDYLTKSKRYLIKTDKQHRNNAKLELIKHLLSCAI